MTGSALDVPPVICAGGRPLRPERWSPWRHGNWSYIVTLIGTDGAPVEGATVDIGFPGHYAHAMRLRGWYRCPACHPRGNPGRLAVDGREYARRRKARKRRKRR